MGYIIIGRSPASKQRMSKWVVEAISLAYQSAGQPSPMVVRSHSTRSMAAPKALISGVGLQEVCDAAGWSSPCTFIRFIIWTWTLPQVPKCFHPCAARYISHRTGTRRHGGAILTFPKSQNRGNESSLDRERSVTTVTSVL